MGFPEILQAISSVGFPIVACCYMVYTNNRQSERHAEETKAMTEAINEMKLAIQALTDKLNN